MTGIRRWMALGAVLTVLTTAGCKVIGPPPVVAQTPAGPVLPTLGPLETATLYFIGPAGSAGGIYTLHNGVLKRIFANSTAAFRQSGTILWRATPSHQQYIVWVDNDAPGGTGALKVHNTVTNADTNIGWSTITNAITPQWQTYSGVVVVAYHDASGMHVGEINLDNNATWTDTTPPSCCLHLIDESGGYAILGDVETYDFSRIIRGTTSEPPAPVVAPPGEQYVRVQSLRWDGATALALLQPTYPLKQPGVDRTLAANAIVNYATGTILPVPGGGTLKGGMWDVNHQLALRLDVNGNDVMRLISQDATPVGTVTEDYVLPTSVANLDFLTWSP
jgi:hypothetical protein